MKKLFALCLCVGMVIVAAAQQTSRTVLLENVWYYTHFPWCKSDAQAFDRAEKAVWREASVPGTVQMDMFRDGHLPDLFYGQNFYRAVWLENEDFLYRTTFERPRMVAGERLWIEFEGLDCFATVWINGRQVAKTHNMFKIYAFDVTDMVTPGENRLLVRLAAPMKELFKVVPLAAENMKKLSCAFLVKERLVTRKVQMNYGWDNVPRIITSGIYRPVKLRVASSARIDNVWFRTALAPDHSKATATVAVELSGNTPFDGEVEAVLSRGGKRFTATQRVKVGSVMTTATLKIDVTHPELWWPAGLGEHPLYDLQVNVKRDGKITDSYKERVGIREIKVITDPVEKRSVTYRIGNPDKDKPEVMDGGFVGAWSKIPLPKPEVVDVTPLKFYVNGRYVFIKGFNMQPLDVFESRLTPQRFQRTVTAAVAVGANMLRIWGGGNVESPWFYDACDEQGIMVWQDFFYASGQYPNNPEFLEEIEGETINVTKRLRNRASLAAWCGDNESDMVNHDRGAGQFANKISHEVQKRVMAIHDPDRYWHPSSPSGGGYPRSPWGGDKRNWGAASPENDYMYIRSDEGRFISEGGAPSIEQLSVVNKFIPREWQWPVGGTDYYRMHWGDVPTMRRDFVQDITGKIAKHFGQWRDLEEFIYLSQVFQAHGIPRMAQHFRSRTGECGGVLLWKWADTWPSICYSVIDYEEFLKPGWYTLRRAFAPTTLMIDNQADKLTVKYLNDGVAQKGRKVMCKLAKFDGSTVKQWHATVDFAANSAGVALDPKLNRMDIQSGEYYIKIWIEGDASITPYYYIPSDMVNVKIKPCTVTTKITRRSPSTVDVTFTAAEYTPYVVIWANDPFIKLSDNAFFLEKGESRTITFSVAEGELWGDFTYRWWGAPKNETFMISSKLLKPVGMNPTTYP